MSAKKQPSGPTPVEAIVHGDKRTNIPTADAHAFVSPAVEEPRWWEAERDANLGPKLVWKGKADEAPLVREHAWATLNQTSSRPFPTPSTEKIAIKVINDYGHEVLQVFEVVAT